MPTYIEFEIEREYRCTPEQLYRAWEVLEYKERWFRGPEGWKETERTLDLREGGSETMHGIFPGGMLSGYNAHYYSVVPASQMGYSFDVRLGEELYSISLVVVTFDPGANGTVMRYHEQLAIFGSTQLPHLPTDPEGLRTNRIHGTNMSFNRLEELMNECSGTL